MRRRILSKTTAAFFLPNNIFCSLILNFINFSLNIEKNYFLISKNAIMCIRWMCWMIFIIALASMIDCSIKLNLGRLCWMLGTVLWLLFSLLFLFALFTFFIVVMAFAFLVLLFAMCVTHLFTRWKILSYAAIIFMFLILLFMFASWRWAKNSVFFG